MAPTRSRHVSKTFLVNVIGNTPDPIVTDNAVYQSGDFAVGQSRLLDSIGSAQMEQEIERRVPVFTKQIQDKMVEETGIEPSLTEDETKRYLEQVIREVKKQKTSHGTRNSNNL
jgi:uncharacterized protein YifE (UPF0438 family)